MSGGALRIEIVTIGDELLLGYTIDTNGALIARELAAAGVEIARRTSVRDVPEEITAGLREALERTGAVITTGGLGPTADDMTRPTVAALFGREMHLDQSLVDMLHARFARLGPAMPKSNLVQAMVPDGARVLENRHGSAPGLWIEDERGRWVAMLPGVPREVRGMLADTLLPLLRARLGDVSAVVSSRTLRTTGIGESALAERLGEYARVVDGLTVASLPGWEGVDLRLTVRDAPAREAASVLDRAVAKLRTQAEPFVYGEDGSDLAAIVLEMARARGLTIAVGESCTGGMLGARLTAISGSSDVFAGGVIAYANAVKVEQLGVPDELIAAHGAVSEQVAAAMAVGAADLIGASIGIGITGVAGPNGGTADKPVGLVWIGVRVDGQLRTSSRVYVGDRDEIRRRACQGALDLLRRELGARQ